MSHVPRIDGLHEFLDGKRLMTFADFTASSESGAVIVIGCYLDVDEGVDMWNDHQSKDNEPRYMLCYH